MNQQSMGTAFEKYSETTQRARFLGEMEQVVPWTGLCALIAPHCRWSDDGRPRKNLMMLLRIYFLQQWFNLSDPGVEEALRDSASMRHFVGIDLGEHPVPDETTICRFRHLLERHGLGVKLFQAVHHHLEAQGIKVGIGTIVDATIINASPSMKDKDTLRDPGMYMTRRQLLRLSWA